MQSSLTAKSEVDWSPVMNQMRQTMDQRLPVYPGELNMALLNQSGLHNHPKGEAVFELAREISRLIGLIDAHEEKNL